MAHSTKFDVNLVTTREDYFDGTPARIDYSVFLNAWTRNGLFSRCLHRRFLDMDKALKYGEKVAARFERGAGGVTP